MSDYLARLKAANSGKALPDELPKLSKGAFGSNDSSPSSTFSKIEATNDETEQTNPDAERRRARALAMLAANPDLRIAVVAKPGNPAIVGVAIRGVAYGELQIPNERYDVAALVVLMDRRAGEMIH